MKSQDINIYKNIYHDVSDGSVMNHVFEVKASITKEILPFMLYFNLSPVTKNLKDIFEISKKFFFGIESYQHENFIHLSFVTEINKQISQKQPIKYNLTYCYYPLEEKNNLNQLIRNINIEIIKYKKISVETTEKEIYCYVKPSVHNVDIELKFED